VSPIRWINFWHNDVRLMESAVANAVTVLLNDNQFVPLVSFPLQCWHRDFEHSTLLTLFNRGQYKQMLAQLIRCRHMPSE